MRSELEAALRAVPTRAKKGKMKLGYALWRSKMKAQTTGTLIDGVVQLDEPVSLPNNSRVSVSIEPLSIDPAQARAAFEAFKKRIQERPIHSGGRRFTRDELHERR